VLRSSLASTKTGDTAVRSNSDGRVPISPLLIEWPLRRNFASLGRMTPVGPIAAVCEQGALLSASDGAFN